MSKKISLLLAIAIVLTLLLPISTPVVQAADTVFSRAGDTKTYDFEDCSLQGWGAAGSITIGVDTSAPKTGSYGLKASNSSANWHGAQLNITSFPAGTYKVEGYVKLVSAETGALKITHQHTDTGAFDDARDQLAADNAVTSTSWTKLEGTFTLSKIMVASCIRFESGNSNNTPDYYLDDIIFTLISIDDTKPQTPATSINSYEYDFDDATAQGWSPRGAGVSVATSIEEATSSPNSIKVTGRSANWNGASINALGKLDKDVTYTMKAKVKSINAAATPSAISLTMQQRSAADMAGTEYKQVASTGIISDGNWHEISGTYSFTEDMAEQTLYFESSDPYDSFYIDDIYIASPGAGVQNIGFEDNTAQGFTARIGGNVTATADDKKAGTYSLLVSDRTNENDGPALDVSGKMLQGSKYNFSTWLKLAPGVTQSNIIFMMAYTIDGDTWYTNLYGSVNDPIVISSSDGWVNLNFDYLMAYDADQICLFIETRGDTYSFYIDDFCVTYLLPENAGSPQADISTAAAMTEGNLNSAKIDVTLTNDTFIDEILDKANFSLVNAPSGCTIAGVEYNATTTCAVNLTFDGTDFDTDIADFKVITGSAETTSGSDLTSNDLTIIAISDDESLILAHDSSIFRRAEDGQSFYVTLNGGTYADSITSENWTVTNLPIGVTKGEVKRVDDTHVQIFLSGNSTVDYNTDITDVTVSCTAAEYKDSSGATTDLSANTGITLTAYTTPTISVIGEQTTDEDTTVGPIDFTIGCVVLSELQLSAASDNTDLLPSVNDTYVFAGSSETRSLTIKPAANKYGTANITVTVKDKYNGEATSTFRLTVNAVDNVAPTATVQAITGTLQAGATLTGHYTYSDVNPEGTSTFKWYRADTAAGANKTPIAGATSLTYVLQTDDIGKYISFEVTPVAAVGTAQGTAVESALTRVIAAAGSDSGGSGSSDTVSVTPIITVAEVKSESAEPAKPWVNPFSDVKESDWYYSAVQYVAQNGLMRGNGSDAFSPQITTNRGMIATILYGLNGSSEASESTFKDVKPGTYYAKAVAWAQKNGFIAGYGNGMFGPEDSITREQMAIILWRYSGSPVAVDSTGLASFKDAGEISSYAKNALAWAYQSGIINGKGGSLLDPKGKATRAEVAKIILNFIQKANLMK